MYLKEGLVMVDDGKKKATYCHLFLMSDILLETRPLERKRKKFQYRGMYSLRSITEVVDATDFGSLLCC